MSKLNKKPYTKEELDAIVLRMENRLGANLFFYPNAKVVEPVAAPVVVKPVDNVIVHTDECRCDECLVAKLDAMLAKSEITLSAMKVAFNQTEVIA